MTPSEILRKVPPIRPDSSIEGLKQFAEASLKRGSIIIEVGCYAGESTQVLANYADKLYCVDAWDFELFPSCPEAITMQDVENAFDIRMAPWKELLRIRHESKKTDAEKEESIRFVHPFQKIKQRSELAEVYFKAESVDAVYIDADHWYASVCKDIRTWLPKIKEGGIIAGHDYNDERWRPEVNRAVDELLGKPDAVFPDCSWMKIVTRELLDKYKPEEEDVEDNEPSESNTEETPATEATGSEAGSVEKESTDAGL